MAKYEGPVEIGYSTWVGRGTTYHADFEGHNVEVYITEKRKKIRIFVDRKEWKPDDA